MDEKNLKVIVENLKNGEMKYFSALFESTKKVVFYNIYSIVKNYETSEDLTQDVFMKFLENLDSIDTSKSISGYFMVLSRNVALNYIRKISKEEDFENYEFKASTDDTYNSDEMILMEKVKKILNEKELNVFLLHYYSDLTFEEISKIKGSPLGTVIWLYNSGIKKLRKELADYDIETN